VALIALHSTVVIPVFVLLSLFAILWTVGMIGSAMRTLHVLPSSPVDFLAPRKAQLLEPLLLAPLSERDLIVSTISQALPRWNPRSRAVWFLFLAMQLTFIGLAIAFPAASKALGFSFFAAGAYFVGVFSFGCLPWQILNAADRGARIDRVLQRFPPSATDILRLNPLRRDLLRWMAEWSIVWRVALATPVLSVIAVLGGLTPLGIFLVGGGIQLWALTPSYREETNALLRFRTRRLLHQAELGLRAKRRMLLHRLSEGLPIHPLRG
jgi:membrane-associated protease RseP (regulator of RpoE activity)